MNLRPFVRYPFLQPFIFLRHLPLAWFAGIRLVKCDENTCITRLKTGWRTRNPFGSMYFGSLQLGAEVAMGLPLLAEVSRSGKSISTLIVSSRSVFHSRGTGPVFFTCNDISLVRQLIQQLGNTEQGITLEMYTRTCNEQGELVSETWITWGFKLRKNKKREQ